MKLVKVSYKQVCIESIQDFTGLPWWVSIASLTVVVRLTMVPLFLQQFKAVGPIAGAMPDLRLLTELTKSSEASNFKKAQIFVQTFRNLCKAKGAKPLKASMYAFLQVPHFLTYVWSVRYLCATNPALEQGGAFWFKNLAEADPYCILPVMASGLTYLTLNKGITPENRDWPINRLRVFCQICVIATLPVSATWPAGVFCYWIVSAGFSLLQSTIITHPEIFKRLYPNIVEEMTQVYSKSMHPEEADKLVKFIETGEEHYHPVTEQEAISKVQTYIKHQNKLSRTR